MLRRTLFYTLSAVSIGILITFTGCGTRLSKPVDSAGKAPTQRPYKVYGKWYVPLGSADGYVKTGMASWYGKDFHGKMTSNGEVYDMYGMTAAHKTLPLGTYVKVTRLDKDKSAVVRINDRGPFVKGRIIDLSYSAAKELDIVGEGVAMVRIEALGIKKGVSYVKADYSKGSFTVQVGAFRVQENALNLKEELSKINKDTAIETYNNGGGVFYRVRVGRYSTIDEAEKARSDFESQGFDSPFVVATK